MTLERSTQACGLKVDGGIFTALARVPELAGVLEQQGYDACWTGEINHDPFLPLLLAAEHTSRLELGTSIAVAFARNPMTVANVGWDLQTYSQGRFILGLGTQIKPHIESASACPGVIRWPGCASSCRRCTRSGRPGRTTPGCGSRVSSTRTSS